MKQFLIFSVLLLASVGTTRAEQKPKANLSTDGVVDLVYLDEKRPIFLRLHIESHRRPYRRQWTNSIKQGLATLDTNGDGVLTKDETPPKTMPKSLGAMRLLAMPVAWDADVAPHDGKITLSEAAEFLAARVTGPLQISSDKESQLLVSPGVIRNEGDLFSMIDRDGDGRLTAKEMRQAAFNLGKRDLDRDEALSATEANAEGNPFVSFTRQPNGLQTPLAVLNSGNSHSGLMKHIRSKYREKSRLNLPEWLAKKADADGNGKLDDEEFRHLLRSPTPQAAIAVRFGKPEETAEARIIRKPKTTQIKLQASQGLVSISVEDVLIEVSASGSSSGVRDQIVAQFRRSDADNNEYLDGKELNAPLFRSNLTEFDADGNSKLYLDELMTVVDCRIAAARSRTRIDVRDLGQAMFTVLDVNRDLSVGQREFLEAARRLKLWDRNGDGGVTSSEVPHLYSLQVGPGQPTFSGLNPVRNNNTGQPMPQAVVKGPVWFQRMDKNRDGDLSPQEFLASPERFQSIDRDGDGLIDADEATAIGQRDN